MMLKKEIHEVAKRKQELWENIRNIKNILNNFLEEK